MKNVFIMKLVFAGGMLGILGVVYFSAKWALSNSLKRGYPTQAEKTNCKEKAKDLVWVQSKQILYYTIAILSILAYLLPWDFASWYCLIFTAILSFMEAKDYNKAITDTNTKLSRALKKK